MENNRKGEWEVCFIWRWSVLAYMGTWHSNWDLEENKMLHIVINWKFKKKDKTSYEAQKTPLLLTCSCLHEIKYPDPKGPSLFAEKGALIFLFFAGGQTMLNGVWLHLGENLWPTDGLKNDQICVESVLSGSFSLGGNLCSLLQMVGIKKRPNFMEFAH